jgi:hypothetical protein
VLHQADARGVGHPLRQQAVDQGDDAAEDVGQQRKAKLGQQKHAEPVEQAARQPFPQRRRSIRHPHQLHDVVDDQLADIEGNDRQQRPQQPQQQGQHGQIRTRPPHHRNERSERAQCAEPRFQRTDVWSRRLRRGIAICITMPWHLGKSSAWRPGGLSLDFVVGR